MDALRVTGITIYPIKSTAGIAVDRCEVEPQGLAMDRRWLLVGSDGDAITGREFPILTQVRTQVEDDGLRVAAPGMDDTRIPFPGASADGRSVTVWDDVCRALGAGAEADEWFRTLLGATCQLVFMGDTSVRPVDSEVGRQDDRVSFADAYPLLLISEASLTDLKARAGENLSMRRFRPNLVVGGCTPYAEDEWRSLRIGGVEFDGVENCARCGFTTIDPDNGEKHPQQEPLRTLGKYRRGPGGGVLFGRNLIPRSLGTVRVGDAIHVNDDV